MSLLYRRLSPPLLRVASATWRAEAAMHGSPCLVRTQLLLLRPVTTCPTSSALRLSQRASAHRTHTRFALTAARRTLHVPPTTPPDGALSHDCSEHGAATAAEAGARATGLKTGTIVPPSTHEVSKIQAAMGEKKVEAGTDGAAAARAKMPAERMGKVFATIATPAAEAVAAEETPAAALQPAERIAAEATPPPPTHTAPPSPSAQADKARAAGQGPAGDAASAAQAALSLDAAPVDPSSIPMIRVVRKVCTYLWPAKGYKIKLLVTTSVMCVLVAKCLKVVVPFWFKSIVDALTPATVVTTTTAAATTTTTVGAGVVTLGPLTLGVFGCVVAYGICRISASVTEELKTILFAPVGGHASTVLAMEMFEKLHSLDLPFHLNRETGSLSKDLDRGSRAFWSLAYTLLFLVVPTAFEMALVCTALNTQAGPQFIAVAAVAVLSYVVWTTLVTNWRARFRTRYNALDSRLGGLIVDSLLNYETVKYFGTEKYESARIRKETTNMNSQLVKLDSSVAILNVGQQLIFALAGVLSLYMATCGVISGAMTIGDLVLVDALLMQLYLPLSYLGMIYREVQTSTQNMQAMIALLDQQVQIKEAPDARPYVYRNGTIELRNVSFAYKKDGDRRLILDNLSLTIPGGKTVAFVGPSGSGKSTIFRLLFRFYAPTSGEVVVDGQPLSQLQTASVRRCIGVIPQDTVLFNETVKYNIRYGRMDASDAEVIAAAKQASLHETVMRMSNGYDTAVGERGLKLSGGEKQRVAIARVLLEDPPILLADEATSALDSTTELDVMRTLRGATRRHAARTIILIAHRLSTVREADVIFVLDGKGGVAEQGTHYELLYRGGLYAQMWYQQLRERRRAEEEKEGEKGSSAGHAAATTSAAAHER